MSFNSPPLNFLGNKARWRREFKEVIKTYIQSGIKIFVDVFGGSGYCSYMVKQCINELGLNIEDFTIIYNDFDNYSERLRDYEYNLNIKREIYDIVKNSNTSENERLPDDVKEQICEVLIKYNNIKPVDIKFISMLFIHQMAGYEGFDKIIKYKSFYNRITHGSIKKIDNLDEYLEHLDIIRMDCMEVLEKYNDVENTCYILDPPYINDFRKTYTGYDVRKLFEILYKVLFDFKYFIYFSSDKSFIPKILKNDEVFIRLYNDETKNKILNMKYIKRNNVIQGYSIAFVDYMFYLEPDNVQ